MKNCFGCLFIILAFLLCLLLTNPANADEAECPETAVNTYEHLIEITLKNLPDAANPEEENISNVTGIFHINFQVTVLTLAYPACNFSQELIRTAIDYGMLLLLSDDIPEQAFRVLSEYYRKELETYTAPTY